MDEERRGFVSEEEGENGYRAGNSQCPVMLSTRSWFVICAIYLNTQSSSCLSWVDGGDSETLHCQHFLAHSWLHLTMLAAHPPPHNAGMVLGDGYPVRFAQHLVHTSCDAFHPARVTRLHRGGYRGYFQHTCEDKIAVHLATLVTSWWVLIYPFQTPACIWFLLHHPFLFALVLKWVNHLTMHYMSLCFREGTGRPEKPHVADIDTCLLATHFSFLSS